MNDINLKEIYEPGMGKPHGYYVDGRQVKPAWFPEDVMLYCGTAFQSVAKTRVGRFQVSTCFLSQALDFGDGQRYFFETALFDRGNGSELHCILLRYEAYDIAEFGHEAAVGMLKARQKRRDRKYAKHRRSWH